MNSIFKFITVIYFLFSTNIFCQNKEELLSVTEKNYLAYKICMIQKRGDIKLLKENMSEEGIYEFNKEQIYEEYDSLVCNVLNYYDYMHTQSRIESYRLPSVFDKFGLAVYIVYDEFSSCYVLGITDSGRVYLFNGFGQNDFQKFITYYFKKIDSEEKAWEVSKFYFDFVTFSPNLSGYDIVIDKENINNYQKYIDIIKPIEIIKIHEGYQVRYYIINSATKVIILVNIMINYNGNINYDYKIIKEPESSGPDIIQH